ncbi:MAG TPA: AAA family ATPase [Pseudonocardiaceae bacterium]
MRYATRAQLAIEERLVAQAQADAAPRLTRAGAALAGRAQEIQDHHPERSELTADQSAAVLSGLTDGKRVSVINAPAGSGKTRVLAEAARVWAAAGRGPVVGITPSQSARNTLAAGVAESCNTARFLGDLPGERGARGPLPISEGTLLLVDEASMIPTPDPSDLVSLAGARRAKVVLAGDTGQLQAVENGGAMSLLAGALGYARLADPVPFRAAWEQAASLRLRTGDAPVLAEYNQHDRISCTLFGVRY